MGPSFAIGPILCLEDDTHLMHLNGMPRPNGNLHPIRTFLRTKPDARDLLKRPFPFFKEHDMKIATKADSRLVCILMPMNGNFRIRQQCVQYPLRISSGEFLKSYAYRCLSLFRAFCSNSLSKSLSILCISISLCCEVESKT